MYKLEYLPFALQDMTDIVKYIADDLKSPDAAQHLAERMIEVAESVREYPYALPVYVPIRKVKHEYRKIIVDNYIMFYWVDGDTITIARVIYAKRNLEKQIEK